MQDKNNLFMNCAIELEEVCRILTISLFSKTLHFSLKKFQEKRRNSALKTQLDAYKWQLDESKMKTGDCVQEMAMLKSENERLTRDLKQYLDERNRAKNEQNSEKDLKHEMKLLQGNKG